MDVTEDSSHPDALLLACHQNNEAAALKLLSVTSVNDARQLMQAADASGLTPILAAAKHGSARVVQALVDRGADLAACLNASRNTALHLAAVKGNVQAVKCIADKMLLLGLSVDIRNNNGDTALMFAAAAGHIGAAATLLKAGANIDARNGDGLTPLLVGASHAGILKLLTRVAGKTSILAARDMHGNGPLHIACRSGSPDAVAFLLQQGRNVTERNLAGRTPRDEARLSGNAECLRLVEEVWGQMEELALQRSKALLLDSSSVSGASNSSSGSCHGGSVSDATIPSSPTSDMSDTAQRDQQQAPRAPETPAIQPPKLASKPLTPLESPFAQTNRDTTESAAAGTQSDPKPTSVTSTSPPASMQSVVASREVDEDGLLGSGSVGMYSLQCKEWMTANCWQEHLEGGCSSPSTPTSALRSSMLDAASMTGESVDMSDLDSGTWHVPQRSRRQRSRTTAPAADSASSAHPSDAIERTPSSTSSKAKPSSQPNKQLKQAIGGNAPSQRIANSKPQAVSAGGRKQGGDAANAKPALSKSPPGKAKTSPKRSKANSQAKRKLPFPHVVSGIYPPPQQSTSPPKPLPSKLTVKTTFPTATNPHPPSHRSSLPSHHHASPPTHSSADSYSQSHSDDSFYDMAWEVFQRDCPAAGTLGLTVQSALGSGLSSLSMSQLEALEGFHHAALARLSDARYNLTRQLELDRATEQSKLIAEVACLAAKLRMYETSGGGPGH